MNKIVHGRLSLIPAGVRRDEKQSAKKIRQMVVNSKKNSKILENKSEASPRFETSLKNPMYFDSLWLPQLINFFTWNSKKE